MSETKDQSNEFSLINRYFKNLTAQQDVVIGIGEVGLQQNIPVAFGLLTTDNLQQALERAGDNQENKGEEAALTVLEMLELFKTMQEKK